jgi:hypothetical protein
MVFRSRRTPLTTNVHRENVQQTCEPRAGQECWVAATASALTATPATSMNATYFSVMIMILKRQAP